MVFPVHLFDEDGSSDIFDDSVMNTDVHHLSDELFHHDHTLQVDNFNHEFHPEPLFGDSSTSDLGIHHQYLVHQTFESEHPNGMVIGNPEQEMPFWHQQSFPDDCGIVAQQMGLESLTGKHFSEEKLCDEAFIHGCYIPGGGTPADCIGHLYELHGYSVEHKYNATFTNLSEKLGQGEKVIVGVNSEIIWAPDHDSIIGKMLGEYHAIPGQTANHAVEVIGIVYPKNDFLHPKVILNDSGVTDGEGIMIPLEQFEKAWAASDHFMVNTMLHAGNHAEIGDEHNFIFSEQSQQTEHAFVFGCSDSFNIWNDHDCTLNGHKVGYINGRYFYDTWDHYVGELGADGNIYDSKGNQIGWVDDCHNTHDLNGTIRATGPNGMVSTGYFLFGFLGMSN